FEAGLTRLNRELEQIPNLSEVPEQLGIEPRVLVGTLERARLLSRQAGHTAYESCELARRTLAFSLLPSEDALYDVHAPALLRQLELDSGLAHYRAADPSTPPAERLRHALDHAAQRYASTPEHERVYR